MKVKLTAAFAVMLALAPAAWSASAGVTLTAKIAAIVAFPAGQDQVTVPVTLTLVNASEQAVTLESSNRCQIRIWSVTDSKGANVENHSFCTMEYAPQSNPLAAGEQRTATENISLRAPSYREGEAYTLHYRFWGISAEAKFAVKTAK